MNAAPVKDQVQEALNMEWESFAARHPHLSAMVDQTVMVDTAAAHLADDPEYQKAMTEAAALGMGAAATLHIVRGFLQSWLTQLLH